MILTRNRSLRSRMGFTLVELMVAAALAITIMWILAESFKMGIDFARSARSTGDMMTQLNNAGQIMLRDLQAPHFAPGAGNNNGQLSMAFADQMGTLGAPAAFTGYTPPAGYFQVVSPPPTALLSDDVTGEGFQLSTTAGPPIPANPPGASLAFTVFLTQGLPQNQFVATIYPQALPPTTLYSRAAEVAYFLEVQQAPAATQTDSVTVTTALSQEQPNLVGAPQPLYTLYRRQRLVAIPTDNQLPLNPYINPTLPQYDPNAGDVISYSVLNMPPQLGGPQYVPNTLPSFGTAYSWQINPNGKGPPRFHYQPASRFGLQQGANQTRLNPLVPLAPIPATSPRHGDDILLSNVLSFEVQAIWTPSPTIPASNGAPILAPRPYTVQNPKQASPTTPGYPTYPASATPYNSNYPFDNFSALTTFNQQLPYTFDTWYQLNDLTNAGLSWNNFSTAGKNPNLIPMPIRVSALQFTIRIYDPKTKQSRQNTWRVAM